MPRFKVTDPETGLTATLEGDSAPNEQELVEVFGVLDKKIRPSGQAVTRAPGEMTQPRQTNAVFPPQAFPAQEQRATDLAAQDAARRPSLPAPEQIDVTAGARQEPPAREAEIEPIGKPGSFLYGATEVAASVLNRPEYLAAMANPATAAAVALRFTPGVVKQFTEDLGKATQGDDQALGRAAMIGIPALFGAVKGGRTIAERMRAQTELERARGAADAAKVDALARQELQPPTMLKRSEAELAKILGERTTDAISQRETAPLPVEVPPGDRGEVVAQVREQTPTETQAPRPDDTGAEATPPPVPRDIESKPAPPVTEQAPESPAPTAAAVSEAEPTGVAAPEGPRAISEPTTPLKVEQPISNERIRRNPPELQTPEAFTADEIQKLAVSRIGNLDERSTTSIVFDISGWTDAAKKEAESIRETFTYSPEGTDKVLIEFPAGTRPSNAVEALVEAIKTGDGPGSSWLPIAQYEAIKQAIKRGNPVLAESVNAHGFQLPKGYVETGGVYRKLASETKGNKPISPSQGTTRVVPIGGQEVKPTAEPTTPTPPAQVEAGGAPVPEAELQAQINKQRGIVKRSDPTKKKGKEAKAKLADLEAKLESLKTSPASSEPTYWSRESTETDIRRVKPRSAADSGERVRLATGEVWEYKGISGYKSDNLNRINGWERVTNTPKKPPIVGMGGAVPEEFAPGGGAGTDIYGIAERVRKQRAEAGQTLPVEPGEGIAAADSVERGRQLLGQGADPERVMANFEKTKQLSADDMAVARAYGESLFQSARRVESKFGTESEEYVGAFKRASDWDKRSKAMQTEWHKMGQAQQGETDIDTGTFTGLQRAYGEEFTAKQAKVAHEHVAKVQKAETEAAEAQAKLTEALKALEKAQAEKPKVSSYVLKVAERWVAEWGKEAESARKALAGKFLSPTPEDLLNLAKIARYDIAQIGLDFAKWTEKMVREFGPKVEPYLRDAWAKGQELIDRKAGQLRDKEVGQQVKRTITKEADPVTELWKRAKAMIDAGETDPQAIFAKLATETGRPIGEVRELLTKPKAVKRVSDEMYVKMAQRRRVVSAAKAWVRDQRTPGWLRFMRSVPRIFFIDKIFGHGTVGMITHAGINIFNPGAWRTYWPAFIKQYGLVFNRAYHERMMQDLLKDPLYAKARRAGLANDPYKYADDYQNAVMRTFMNSKLGRLAGGEGFDALKLFRQARFNQIWNALPDTLQTPEMATMIADSVNHVTGIVNSRFPEWSGWAFFAPKLEASRWAWAVKDTAKAGEIISRWNKASPEERRFAMMEVREKATIAGVYFGLLAANQGLLSAMGSNEQINFTNPRRGDFLSFKIAGHKVGVVGPMLGMVRLLAELLHESMGQRGKLERLTPRGAEFGSTLGQYARGKLSPFAGQVVNVLSQADYQGRPLPWSSDEGPAYLRKRGQGRYGYGEYFAQEFTPIPVSEAIREVWDDQGMDRNMIATAMKALTVGLVAGGTGARITKDFTPTPAKNQ